MIIKNNKCGKIFTKSKYIFLQRQKHDNVLVAESGRERSRSGRRVVVCSRVHRTNGE